MTDAWPDFGGVVPYDATANWKLPSLSVRGPRELRVVIDPV
jgi:hypothetical protein